MISHVNFFSALKLAKKACLYVGNQKIIWHQLIATSPQAVLKALDHSALEIASTLLVDYSKDWASFNPAIFSALQKVFISMDRTPVVRFRPGPPRILMVHLLGYFLLWLDGFNTISLIFQSLNTSVRNEINRPPKAPTEKVNTRRLKASIQSKGCTWNGELSICSLKIKSIKGCAQPRMIKTIQMKWRLERPKPPISPLCINLLLFSIFTHYSLSLLGVK